MPGVGNQDFYNQKRAFNAALKNFEKSSKKGKMKFSIFQASVNKYYKKNPTHHYLVVGHTHTQSFSLLYDLLTMWALFSCGEKRILFLCDKKKCPETEFRIRSAIYSYSVIHTIVCKLSWVNISYEY